MLRSAALRERAREYIAACEVQGLSAWRSARATWCRTSLPLIVAQGTLLFGYAMVDLAAISFIGLGVQPPQADWGVMVASGQAGRPAGLPGRSRSSAGLCIVVVVVAVNLLGERLAERQRGASMSDDLHYLSGHRGARALPRARASRRSSCSTR